jgi:glycosyltransferase involved in cell wall biosynthesis
VKIFYLSQIDLKRHYSGSVHVNEIVRAFAAAGHSVLVFAQRGDGSEQPQPRVRVSELGTIVGGSVSYLRYQCRLLLKTLYLGIRQRPDLLYVRSECAMFAHVIASKLLRIPYFLELNSWPFRDLEKVREVSSAMRWFVTRIVGCSIRNAKGVVCVTPEIAARLRKRYRRDHGVIVAENGVNVRLFKPASGEWARKRLGLRDTDFVVGMVAYFQYYNDVEIAIRATEALQARMPNAKLLLVGGWAQEERRGEVDKLISQIEGGMAVLTGEVPYPEVPSYIASFDLALALFNTDVGDGSVMKAHEYLACSKAVIGSDMGSMRFLEQTGTGVIVPIGDLEALVDAVECLAADRQRVEKMGAKGCHYVAENRSWDMVADRILSSIEVELAG